MAQATPTKAPTAATIATAPPVPAIPVTATNPKKVQLIVIGSIAIILLAIVGVIAFQMFTTPGGRGRQVKVDPSLAPPAFDPTGRAPAIPAKPESEWLPKFKQVYALDTGQVMKRIPKPFIPERLEFYRARMGDGQV